MGEFYQKLTAEVAEKTPDKDVDRTSPSALELDALKPQLHKELNHIRKLCDKHLPKQEAREMDEYENENYPLGCCGHITPWFIDMMPAFAECSPEKYPALARTLEIAQPFKRLYGIQSSKFFCNGIQLGTIFIDPAADSVKGATEQVIIGDISCSDFTPLRHLPLIARTLEEYWGYEIYPNNIYPVLAFASPLIAVSGGQVGFTAVQKPYLLFHETETEFKQTQHFLLNSQHSRRSLPQKYRAQLDMDMQKLLKLYLEDRKYQKLWSCLEFASTPVPAHDFRRRFNDLLGQRANSQTPKDREDLDYTFYKMSSLLGTPLSLDQDYSNTY